MDEKLRKSGISIIGDVSSETHFCQFYQTKQDLLDIVIPYFKSGLENNELCIWILPEFLNLREAKEILKKSITGFDIYLKKGQIEIIPYNDWYLKEGIFDSQKILESLSDKLNQAISNGYESLRLTEEAFRQKDSSDDSANYEERLNSTIREYPIIALCTYSLEMCSLNDIIRIVSNHDFSLSKNKDKWEQIKNTNTTWHKLDNKFLTAINSINQNIHSTLNFDEIMKRTILEASRAIGSDTAAISLRKSESWIVSYVYGLSQDVIGAEMNDKEEPHAVLAIKTKKPIAINDAFNDKRVNQNHMKKWGVRSVLVVPIITKNEVIGVMFLNFQKTTHLFDSTEIHFATQLASSVAMALENSHLATNLNIELHERELVILSRNYFAFPM